MTRKLAQTPRPPWTCFPWRSASKNFPPRRSFCSAILSPTNFSSATFPASRARSGVILRHRTQIVPGEEPRRGTLADLGARVLPSLPLAKTSKATRF